MLRQRELNDKRKTNPIFVMPVTKKDSVENINGLIRWWFPKGTNFDTIKRSEIKFVQD